MILCSQFVCFVSQVLTIWLFGGEPSAHNLHWLFDWFSLCLIVFISLWFLPFCLIVLLSLLILIIDCTTPPFDSYDWLHFSPFLFFWLIVDLPSLILLFGCFSPSISSSVWLLLTVGSFVWFGLTWFLCLNGFFFWLVDGDDSYCSLRW